MSSVNSLLGNVPKLDGNNYHDWKFAISMVLRRAGCWDVLTKEKPSTRTSGDEWEKKTEEALTYIGLTITQGQYGYIRDCTDGPAAWTALAQIYEKNSRATRISLKRQFYGFRHDDKQPIAEYISGITDLAARLKAIKISLTDDDIIDVLIFNLNESWGNIAASLTAASGDLKLNDVKGALIDEEGRRRNSDGDAYQPITLLGNSRTRNRDQNTRRTCFRCGRPGHFQADCHATRDTNGKEIAEIAYSINNVLKDVTY